MHASVYEHACECVCACVHMYRQRWMVLEVGGWAGTHSKALQEVCVGERDGAHEVIREHILIPALLQHVTMVTRGATSKQNSVDMCLHGDKN